jgi:hypothetical protein
VVGGPGASAATDDAASEAGHRRLELLDPPEVRRAGTHVRIVPAKALSRGFRMVTIA